MKRVFILAILVVVFYDAGAEDIRFEKVNVYTTPVGPDLESIVDFWIVGNSGFYIEEYIRVHLNWWSENIYFFNFDSDRGKKLFSLEYAVPEDTPNPEQRLSPLLTEEMFLIDDIVYFPDEENHSYQCTLDGEYLGRFTDFKKPQQDEGSAASKIIVAGNEIRFPFDVDGKSYFNAYDTDRFVIFVGESDYLIFDKMELALQGANASLKKHLLFPPDRRTDASFIPSRFNKAYILYKTVSEFKVSILYLQYPLDACRLESIDIEQPPEIPYQFNAPFPYQGSKYSGEYFYRTEYNYYGVGSYEIVKYRLVGLEGVSSVDERMWRDVR